MLLKYEQNNFKMWLGMQNDEESYEKIGVDKDDVEFDRFVEIQKKVEKPNGDTSDDSQINHD